eukprot:2045342-Prymnesium_polylepis.1
MHSARARSAARARVSGCRAVATMPRGRHAEGRRCRRSCASRRSFDKKVELAAWQGGGGYEVVALIIGCLGVGFS